MTYLSTFPEIADPAARRVCWCGDSTVEGTGTTNGGVTEQLRVLAASRWGRGGDGVDWVWQGAKWSFTTGGNAWTTSSGLVAWDVSPTIPSSLGDSGVKLGNGSAEIGTWTDTADTFIILCVDGASSGNFSYSIDGAAFVDVTGVTWAQDNSIKQIAVNAPVTSNLRIRAADAAGVAVNTYLLGVEGRTKNPGLIVDNVGSASDTLHNGFVRTTLGSYTAWLTALAPDLVITQFTNDYVDVASYETDLVTFVAAVEAVGAELCFVNYFEQSGRDTTQQANLRAATASRAATEGYPCVDLYEIVGDFATADGLGYFSDLLHPSNTGAVKIAEEVWAAIRRSGAGARFKAA